jgi:DNA-binding transcriptional ArsR family regulator
MKPVKAIKDPEAFKLLADETRRKVVSLLRVKEMTVSQIAAELNVTPQAVYHHIKKLLKGEMVEVAREERIDHLIESYYRATAETFFCSVGETPRGLEVAKEQMKTVLHALKKLGFKIQFDENKISQLVDVRVELDKWGDSGKFEDAISELDDVDFLTKQKVHKFAEILSVSDEEFARQQKINKKFRDLLRSLVKK